VARHCDYIVGKKRVNSCVLKHLFLEGVEQPKILPKPPGNALSDALLMSRFQNFAANAAKKNRSMRGFLKPPFARFELIRINSGPNIRRSCFLHFVSYTTYDSVIITQQNIVTTPHHLYVV